MERRNDVLAGEYLERDAKITQCELLAHSHIRISIMQLAGGALFASAARGADDFRM